MRFVGLVLLLGSVLLGLLGLEVWPLTLTYRTNKLIHAPAERIWKVLNSPSAERKWFRNEDGSAYLTQLDLSAGKANLQGIRRELAFVPVGHWQERVVGFEPERRLVLQAKQSGPFAFYEIKYQFLPIDESDYRLSVEYTAELRGIKNKMRYRQIKATMASTMRYSLLGIKALSGG